MLRQPRLLCSELVSLNLSTGWGDNLRAHLCIHFFDHIIASDVAAMSCTATCYISEFSGKVGLRNTRFS